MPNFFDSYFGGSVPTSDITLKITDGELTVDFANSDGWDLLDHGWAPVSAGFKGGGYYADTAMGDGQFLRHTAFDKAVESWKVRLKFAGGDSLADQVDMLEELLQIRAPRYWTDRRYHRPVYVERSWPGESNTAYALISQGRVVLPDSAWDRVLTHDNQMMQPILVSFIRQPFWYGALPGTAQGDVESKAQQDWDYNLLWAEETALPTGYVFCMLEDRTGNIYAGGASEILKWNGAAWAAEATAPVTLVADVTAVIQLANGDILFGEDGRIIKLSGGTYSVETTDPSGQVYALIEARDGVIYAADNGQILKRDAGGTWAVDDTIPSGYVYSFLQEQASSRVFAGGTGEILAQVKEEAQTATTLRVQVASAADQGEQYGSQAYTDPTVASDLDLFNGNYVLMRFQLNVPAGATIKNAKLKFWQYVTVGGSASLAARIYCEDADDAAAVADGANDISSRTLTTSYKSWQDKTKRQARHYWSSIDFAPVLQEVIDRAGWAADQHVAVIVKTNSLASGIAYYATRRQVYGYDLNPSKAPLLEVTYIPAPASDAGWEVISTLPTGNVRSLLQVGNLILAGEEGQMLSSVDKGATWGVEDTTPTNEVRALYQDTSGNIWAGDNGNILKSIDGGRNWVINSTVPTGYANAIVQETTTGDLRAGENSRILILDDSDTVTLGRAATEEDEVFVANHCKVANLTHVYVDDGGAFGSNLFPMTSFPVTLLPAVPAVNDAFYLGIDTSLADTGPFCGLVFDIATPAASTTSYTILWEYYSGAAWATLTVTDETSQLSEVGVKGLFWKQSADWAAVAVNGVTGYWVRARVSALVGTLTPPMQQNRDIYSPVWPHVEIDSNETGGNVDSLAIAYVHNRSDGASGGPGGSEPLLYVNRVLLGVKETEDHEIFRAFLNFADEQNPAGVTVDVTVDPDTATAIQADTNLSSATGRRVFFDAGLAAVGGGLSNFEDRIEIELDTTIARDFYGTYKAFLRCKQSGGSAGEVWLRLKVVSGSGGISFLSDIQVTQSTTDHELIEFDAPITIPVSSEFSEDDIGDVTSLIVQISATQNDADLYLYDLVLLPVDNIWIDAKDVANTAESSLEHGRRLIVDGVSIPKAPTRALVQRMDTDAFVSSWRVAGNGYMRLLAGKKQRVWVLCARTNAAASSLWLSEPEYANSIRISRTDRWITGRGASA